MVVDLLNACFGIYNNINQKSFEKFENLKKYNYLII